MAEQKEENVVGLVGAGVPADQGLSSLGMLMQLGGNLFAAMGALLAFAMLFALRGSGEVLWMLLVLIAGVARSLLHRAAGTQLLYGAPGFSEDGKNNRLSGIRRYIAFALMHTALVGAMLGGKFHFELEVVAGIVLGLAVWPVMLAVVLALPRFRRFKDDLPLTEDKGFEGASILMTVLGLVGVAGAGTALIVLLDLPGRMPGQLVLVMLALVMLVIRSVLHVQAGLSGLRETNVDRSVELANRYANFGVISSFCGGGALLLMVMGSADLGGLVGVCVVSWMLMSWPLIIRRFFSDRQFADLLAGEAAPMHRRAPDAGLTGLGWLLIAAAAYSASFLFVQLFAGDDRTTREMQALLALGGAGGVRSVWFSVGMVVLQAWAGFELVRMSPQSRIIATVFGIVGAIVAVYINLPVLDALKGARGIIGNTEALMLGSLAMALILPVATVVLVNRKIAPTARARFRKPAPQPPTEA